MKSNRTVIFVSGLAHALAWAAFLGMAFSPSFYSGTIETAVGPDGAGGDVVSFSASIIDANGWWVLMPLLVPVALTAIGILAAITWNHQLRNKVFLWAAAALLAIFCTLGIFSVGVFFVPAALALLVAAILMALAAASIPTIRWRKLRTIPG